LQLLGALGMIDANESDWKVIVINTADPLAATYNDISDVPKVGALVWTYASAKGFFSHCFHRVVPQACWLQTSQGESKAVACATSVSDAHAAAW
jgi:inorganic pyrophosphatase